MLRYTNTYISCLVFCITKFTKNQSAHPLHGLSVESHVSCSVEADPSFRIGVSCIWRCKDGVYEEYCILGRDIV